MKKKTVYTVLLSLAAIVCLSVPVYLLYVSNMQLKAAESQIHELLLQKDETTIMEQVDVLAQDNTILREKLMTYEQNNDEGDNTAVKCAERLVRQYYERSYNEHNAEAYFAGIKTIIKDSCTEKGYSFFYPTEADTTEPSPPSAPIGDDVGDGLEVFEEKFLDAIWYLTSYSRMQSDDSVDVLIFFVKDADRDYLGHLVNSTRTNNIFNARMVYSKDKGTWLCDEVYLDTALIGADFTEVR